MTQGTGASSNVFTITPSTDSANGGTFSLTFRASDGVNIASSIASFTLAFSITNSNYTTALITSVGANNAVNNSFVDSSTNSHTITVGGNAHQTTFSPYRHGGYSTYFDGSGDYLNFNGSSISIGTGDFTIEAYVYHTGNSNDTILSTTGCAFVYGINGQLRFYTGTGSNIIDTGTAYISNRWVHVAAVRTSGVLKIFQDGTEVYSGAYTHNIANFTTAYIGEYFSSGNAYFQGYITDLRVVVGTALYTSNYTPPTERLTAITNTGLLTCHLPYIADGSTNSHAITVNGNTKTQPFAPYDYEGYDASTNGGSMYFDGSGDKLTIPGTYANFGTNPFTVEAWVYPSSSVGPIFTTHRAGTASGFYFSMSTSNNTMIHGRYFSSNVETGSSANAVKLNQWNHFAWCREGTGSNQTRMFANGKVVATYTDDQDYSSTPYGPFVGGYDAGGPQYDVNGNIADLRVVSGTALYTAEFTPPTAPLTAVTNTQLFLQEVDAGIIDKSQSIQTMTLNGSVSSSTAQTKYLSSSMYFNGNSSNYIAATDGIALNSAIFTVEFWMRGSNVNPGSNFRIIEQPSGAFAVDIGSSGKIRAHRSGGNFKTANGVLTQDTWHHVAVVREGTGTDQSKIYIDGTLEATGTLGDDYTDSSFEIGGNSTYYTGYLSDLRITKGLARYTANFTPPTAALQG